MRLTNKNNLPDAIYKAVLNDAYTKGESDYSITELLTPPRITALTSKHRDEIEEDVEDRLYALYGTIAHLILERANEDDLCEKRFFGEFGGKIVSAQVDTLSIKDGILSDYKFSTAYKFKPDSEPSPEWTAQLNVQSELLRLNGYDVKKLQIVGLIRDFSKLEVLRNKNYPRSSVVIQPIEMWEREKVVSYIEERVSLHEQAKEVLPECSSEERWAKPNVYAVMKKGRKSAVKRCDTIEEAEILSQKKDHYIEYRPGKNQRCEAYCRVRDYCEQYKKLKGEGNE